MQREALLFGATGAVGRELLKLCLDGDRYSRVTVIARRSAPLEHPKLNWVAAELDTLDGVEPMPGLVNGDAYCCLGTTIKAAGSEAAFQRVDHDFVAKAAHFSKRCGVTAFSMVSAIGAHPKSRSLYNRTKGLAEAAVTAEGFASLRIFRPSLLKGKRAEVRPKEAIANGLLFLLTPIFCLGLRKYKPVDISKLATALYVSADEAKTQDTPYIFESDEIQSY